MSKSLPTHYYDYYDLIKRIQVKRSIDFLKSDLFLLKRVWNGIKSISQSLFKQTKLEAYTQLPSYPKISFHDNPNFGNAYLLDKNSLSFNIYTFLFHMNKGQDDRLFYIPNFIQASRLIHELDHYHYCLYEKVIGKSEEEIKRFHMEHHESLEERAYNREREFLQNCKTILKNPFYNYEFKDSIPDTNVYPDNVYSMIDELMESILKDEIPIYEEYSKDTNIIAIRKNTKIMKKLNIPYDINKNEKDYTIISFSF